jgi:acid ceramidase
LVTVCLLNCAQSRGISKKPEGIFNKNVTCKTDEYPPELSRDLVWFEISYDTGARHRWDEVIETYNDTLNAMITDILNLIEVFDYHGTVLKLVDDALPTMMIFFPEEYRLEILGISEKSKIPVGRLVLYNIFYEVFSACTSIVAENEDGTHYHARNLDFGLFMGWDFANHTWTISEYLRKMEFNVKFTKNGKTLFNSTSFAGYVGIITGVKGGAFSITLNERFVLDGGPVGLLEWFLGHKDLKFATWVLRDTLAGDYTYETAIDVLQTTPLISPCYYIVSGVNHNEGMIITRSHTESLEPLSLDVEAGRWYLLETNYDHWKRPFILDNRRTPGETCMNTTTSYETVDQSAIFNVLSTSPVLNRLTVYTTIMNVNTGELDAYTQNCPTCFIW